MSAARSVDHRKFDYLADNILALDSDIKQCLIVTFPQGALLSCRETDVRSYRFPKITQGTVGMVSHWLVSTLTGFGRANEETSELEYVTVERKLHRFFFFRWVFQSVPLVMCVGLTKQSRVEVVYSKIMDLLKME